MVFRFNVSCPHCSIIAAVTTNRPEHSFRRTSPYDDHNDLWCLLRNAPSRVRKHIAKRSFSPFTNNGWRPKIAAELTKQARRTRGFRRNQGSGFIDCISGHGTVRACHDHPEPTKQAGCITRPIVGTPGPRFFGRTLITRRSSEYLRKVSNVTAFNSWHLNSNQRSEAVRLANRGGLSRP